MNYTNVRSGGQWSPSHCLARHRVRHIHIFLNLTYIIMNCSLLVKKYFFQSEEYLSKFRMDKILLLISLTYNSD
jgi:hypothetical protein